MSALRRFIEWNRRHGYELRRRKQWFFGDLSYHAELRRRIDATLEGGVQRVLEVGGVDRPLLKRGEGFTYVGLDIDDKSECYEVYDSFMVQSVEEPIEGPYDAIVSITVLEHVPDNRAAVHSMFDALVPGGVVHHYMPGKGHPYALVLRLVGPGWQKRLIRTTRPESEAITGYPTYFDHCTATAMTALLTEVGFVDIDVDVHYSANDYFSFFLPAFVGVAAFENVCRRLSWSYFASGFVVSATRPAAG
jgi:SAM-dependent methyltransferase